MTTATAPRRASRRRVLGSTTARVAPPVPLRHDAKGFAELAKRLGQPLWPWQTYAARYLTATGPDGWLYPEVAVVAARQNGKTTLLAPLIIGRLMKGERIMHTAQNRELPRETHDYVATLIKEHFPKLVPASRGIRYGAGQEEIRLTTGGRYRIVAPTKGGARGPANQLVIIDEVLEMEDDRFIAAAKPTSIAQQAPQMVYLSNAGTADSYVLNALRDRSGKDPNLAYLEWSAGPDRKPDDVAGWCEANPSIGHNPYMLRNLEREHLANVLGNTMDVWEREHLCRWTVARTQRLVTPEDWSAQVMLTERGAPIRPVLGIKMDLSGERASAVLAWRGDDDAIWVDVVADITGDPLDVDAVGPELRKLAGRLRATSVVYDPYTDADLARHLPRAKALTGRDYASATERFTRLVAGRKFRVHDPDHILADDLACTTRRATSNGTAIAVKSAAEVTNTAAEAAVRAVWIASAPQPRPVAH